MDPLSDVLRVVRLDGAYFFRVDAVAPWIVVSVPARQLTPPVLPHFDRLISYHVLLEGRCVGGLAGEPLVEMEAGDVIVFPHGDRHRMASDGAQRAGRELEESPSPFPFTTRLGEPEASGPRASFVCGYLGWDGKPFNPLLATLPRVIHVRGRADGWIATFARQALAESAGDRSAARLVLTRLSELMFIEVVRRHLDALPADETGWLAALKDPIVGRALALLHEQPARAWTLGELADAVALSRSAFAERFTQRVGQAPMQYLARWRLQLAANLLRTSRDKVAAVAERVGYQSEAAFSRAFRKEVGAPPAAWRRMGDDGPA